MRIATYNLVRTFEDVLIYNTGYKRGYIRAWCHITGILVAVVFTLWIRGYIL